MEQRSLRNIGLIARTKTIDEPLKRSKVPLSTTDKKPKASTGQEASIENDLASGAQRGGGHLGHLPPPKFSKHCIAILTFAETFK